MTPRSIGASLLGLAALVQGQAVITSDTYFYGQSPPVYPSPNITGTGNWQDAYTRATALVSQMTLQEKVNLTAGVSQKTVGCSGFIPAISRLGFPGMCVSDAGNGLRSADFVSSWPSGIHVGASWNRDLAAKRATGMATEYLKKSINMILGPVVGPAGRVVAGGRNWEGFSVDPYLAGALVYNTVAAVQAKGIITSTKHYIANEQETHRNPSGGVQSVSSNIDDQTMHELYLWPFQDAVLAGSGNIMCSYNRVNNSYGCANSKTLNGLLKTELGFQGVVMSDWGAQHAGVATALAGLDVTMPSAGAFWGGNLTMAVNNGSVPEWRLDDMATRVIASWYQAGQDKSIPSPGAGMPSNLSMPHQAVDGRDASYKQVLYDAAVEGHVLVKNANNALPLKSPKLLSIFGYSAKAPDINTPGSPGWNSGGESSAANVQMSGIAQNGTIVSGGGSGATSQTLIVSPFDALVQQAFDNGTLLFWDFSSQNPFIDAASDACVVIVNAFATEGYDRPNIDDTYTNTLITNVAGKCANTMVIFHNAGIRLVDAFVDHPNVTAIIFAHLPGQYSGRALVDILYGRVSPSGKLPYTVAKTAADYGDLLNATQPVNGSEYQNFPQSDFTEGVYIDYRRFDRDGIAPQYEFGFGLTYTTFAFSNLQTTLHSNVSRAQYPTGQVLQGGQEDLWDIVATVTAEVANTGSLDGAEVPQLYVGIPNAPVRQLRGFVKPFIPAGGTVNVSFDLTRRDLSVWDVVAQKWSLQPGTYIVAVGSSSRDLPLNGTLTIAPLSNCTSQAGRR